ncbi:NUDIX domain-containing protein [Candidatus Frankia nodulisporulans]|uniref:NUDIX domain-containing protein n=1 Tax=Candidatus Frankia nodulisporulans TaxID=2060052 RepID=UPI001CDC1D59|nr:NUDIX hydrolase [Candidatus Frankia nodulisporulans]
MTTPDAAAQLAWQRGLPRKRMNAACLLVDGHSRVLLVKPTYRPGWDLPGGVVEQDESPYAAARREVGEELALDRVPGRLLAVDWVPPSPLRTEGLALVFDGGLLTDDDAARIRLPADELADWTLVPEENLSDFAQPHIARRLHACLAALRTGSSLFLADGLPPG